MSATVAAALKKIAVAVLTNKKLRRVVLGIILGIIIIVMMPMVAILSIFSGDIDIDTDRLQDIVIEEMSDEEKAKLQTVEDMMNAIESAMTERALRQKGQKRHKCCTPSPYMTMPKRTTLWISSSGASMRTERRAAHRRRQRRIPTELKTDGLSVK